MFGGRASRAKNITFIVKIDIDIEDVKDIQEVFRVYADSEDFLSLGPESKATIKMVTSDIQYSKEHGYKYCEIKNNNKTIGICDYYDSGFENKKENGYINLIMIGEKERNKGYGGIVLKNLENKIINSGSKRIIIFVQTNNARAINFWERNGFYKASDIIRNEDTTTVYRMEKQLI